MAFVIYLWIIVKRKQPWTEDSGSKDPQIGIPEAKHSMNPKHLVSEGGQRELGLKMRFSMLGYLEKEIATHSSVLAWRIPGTGGAWWAAVYGVAQSRTRLKRLSSSR